MGLDPEIVHFKGKMIMHYNPKTGLYNRQQQRDERCSNSSECSEEATVSESKADRNAQALRDSALLDD